MAHMLKLSKRDIRQGYKGVKRLAQKAFAKGDYSKAMELIQHCATIAQQFNWIYKDDELECLIEKISVEIIDKKKEVVYKPIHNRVVFYDEFCVSFILAIQYLKALAEAGKEVVYVAFEKSSQKFNLIFDYVKTLPNTKIVLIPQHSAIEDNQLLYDTIMEISPEKVLLHIKANSSNIPALASLPDIIDKYLINLADQTFWLGTSVVDYVLEFRQFGVSVSQQRRGIRPEQQLLVPFYPIIDANPFQGFPAECTQEGKVLIFSGSDIYKVLDTKRMYWHLVKRLLDTYPEVVFLFATKGDGCGLDFLQNFIKENHYEGRFIYTQFRPDINEVLAHTDIYMGTCPASGSLMSQLAARNAKPILQYYYPGTPDDETEQAICINEEFEISFHDENDFMHEAELLIHDDAYRKKQGERLKQAMISEDQFNQIVAQTLDTNKTQIELKPYSFTYKLLDDRWYELENNGYISSINYFYGLLGLKFCLNYTPILFIKKNVNRIFKLIKN